MMQTRPINSGSKRIQMPISQTVQLDFSAADTFGRYKKISSAQTFNMLVSDGALVSFPGYKQVAQIVKNGEAREIYASNRYNHLIVVVNDGVYTISTNYAVAKIGTLNTSTGAVFMAENDGGQIGIADGKNIYIFDYINNSFTVPLIDFLPVYISFQDTYFLAADGRTNQWRLSDNNNGNSWPAGSSNVGVIQTKASNTVAVAPLDRQLFVFGKTFAEPWYDVGSSLFPYQRSNFYNIDYGCLSSETIASGFNKLVWLGSNEKGGFAIMYSQGGIPQKISTDGLDFLFSQITTPEDSFGYLMRIDGHIIYVLTFRTDNLTFAFDFNTNKFFTLTDKNRNYHIAKRVAFFNEKYYFVSFIDGNLYEMGSQYTTYDGDLIPRTCILNHFRLPSSDRFIVQNVTLTLEQGMTKNPSRIDLSISRDGGESYGNIISDLLNPLGARKSLCQFWRLGMTNDLTMKFDFWSDGRVALIGGQMSIYQ